MEGALKACRVLVYVLVIATFLISTYRPLSMRLPHILRACATLPIMGQAAWKHYRRGFPTLKETKHVYIFVHDEQNLTQHPDKLTSLVHRPLAFDCYFDSPLPRVRLLSLPHVWLLSLSQVQLLSLPCVRLLFLSGIRNRTR